jgi:hypothetical protein
MLNIDNPIEKIPFGQPFRFLWGSPLWGSTLCGHQYCSILTTLSRKFLSGSHFVSFGAALFGAAPFVDTNVAQY